MMKEPYGGPTNAKDRTIGSSASKFGRDSS